MKIGINGFGRIGRAALRIALDRKLDVVAVNDVHGVVDASYLLQHDSIYGRYHKNVEVRGKDLVVGGKRIKVFSERDPHRLSWKKLGVDVVIEATGAFRDKIGVMGHIQSGAKYAVITAPAEAPDLMVVPGVNDNKMKKDMKIFSVASCTTNSLTPLTKVLDGMFGIKQGFMTTVHGYTSSQGVVDGFARKPERGRAAALNIVPTSTGATKAVCEVMPNLNHKISGMALRVPVPIVSITDLTVNVKKKTTKEKVNAAFRKASKGALKDILAYNEDHLVSSDIIGDLHSAIFNASDTQVIGDLVKVTAWYDNEWGYSNRVVDVVSKLRKWC